MTCFFDFFFCQLSIWAVCVCLCVRERETNISFQQQKKKILEKFNSLNLHFFRGGGGERGGEEIDGFFLQICTANPKSKKDWDGCRLDQDLEKKEVKPKMQEKYFQEGGG